MKLYSETKLRNFEFWSGAKENALELTWDQLDEVESILEDIYPDGMSKTELNDLFWFDFDQVREWLGIEEDEDEKKKFIKEDNNMEEIINYAIFGFIVTAAVFMLAATIYLMI